MPRQKGTNRSQRTRNTNPALVWGCSEEPASGFFGTLGWSLESRTRARTSGPLAVDHSPQTEVPNVDSWQGTGRSHLRRSMRLQKSVSRWSRNRKPRAGSISAIAILRQLERNAVHAALFDRAAVLGFQDSRLVGTKNWLP